MEMIVVGGELVPSISRSDFTVAVIGGGVAGPVAAIALGLAGITATIYEADEHSSDGIGAMLTLAPNGIAALSSIGLDWPDGIGQALTRTVIAGPTGRRLAAFDGLHDLGPSRALWRADLYRVLKQQAVDRGIAYEYGKRLVSAASSGGRSMARFSDGSTIEADLIVGADGINSTVRNLIDPNAPRPTNVPLLNVGGVADVTVEADVGSTYFVFGRHAFLGYWIEPDRRTAWFANIPDPHPMTGAQARGTSRKEWLTRLANLFDGEQPATALLRSTAPTDVFPLGSIQIMPSLPRWHNDHLAVIGDAAHAPSPSSGQGASLAIESAIELARCLRDLPTPAALAAYEKLRRQRVELVAKRATRTNNTKTLGPLAIAIMSRTMPLALKTVLTPEKMLGLEQRYHIDWAAHALQQPT
jgi:2-polyprenyl-6-methoxyphenol hydroxylase-like FAD-dependent oxidoreductase